MTWVRRVQAPAHTCQPPTQEVFREVPTAWTGGKTGVGFTETVVDGQLNDLWRCDECDQLWRVGAYCDVCDARRQNGGRCARGVYHPAGLKWRPARFLQRLRNRTSPAS